MARRVAWRKIGRARARTERLNGRARCAPRRAGRQRACGNDRQECDRIHRQRAGDHAVRPRRPLPHPLRPAPQRRSGAGAVVFDCGAAEEGKGRGGEGGVTQTRALSHQAQNQIIAAHPAWTANVAAWKAAMVRPDFAESGLACERMPQDCTTLMIPQNTTMEAI
jgi:hypothetical protein